MYPHAGARNNALATSRILKKKRQKTVRGGEGGVGGVQGNSLKKQKKQLAYLILLKVHVKQTKYVLNHNRKDSLHACNIVAYGSLPDVL